MLREALLKAHDMVFRGRSHTLPPLAEEAHGPLSAAPESRPGPAPCHHGAHERLAGVSGQKIP